MPHKKTILLIVFFIIFSHFALSQEPYLPPYNIEVSGTDYTYGDNGQVFTHLFDSQGNDILDANCLVDALYPNSTTLFFSNQPMILDQFQMGFYYYDFTVPNVSGIFKVEVNCEIQSTMLTTNPDVVSIFVGTSSGDPLTNLNTNDGTDYGITDAGNLMDARFNFTLQEPFPATSMILTIDGDVQVGVLTTGVIGFAIYNWTSGTFFHLPNTIDDAGGDETQTITVSSDFVNSEGIFSFRANLTGTAITEAQFDLVSLSYNTTDTISPSVLTGGNELNVRAYPRNIYDRVLDILTLIGRVIGLLEENQAKLNQTISSINQTRVQITNQTQLIKDVNNSLQSQIINTRQNISDQLQELRDNLVFGEAYG